jgi:hypothetical protein
MRIKIPVHINSLSLDLIKSWYEHLIGLNYE